MSELFQQILDWVTLHPLWAGALIFLVAMSESLAIIGLIVPGVAIMFAIGALITTGAIDFWVATGWAVTGAVAGDGLSFWLGHHYRHSLRQSWPFNRHPQSLERGIDFFHKYGGKSVAFGRFFGPVRAVIPLVAGMLGMPPRRFLFANILSALAWAPVYLLPGMLFGASLELASEVALRLVIIIITLAVLIWFVIWLGKRLFRLIQPHAPAIVQYLLDWSRIHPKLGTIAAALADPDHREAKGLSILATLLVIATALFVLIFGAVIQGGILTVIDQMLLQALQSLRTPWADHLMVAMTRLADTAVIYPLMIGLLLYFLWQRHPRTALYWLAAAAFAIVVPPLLKLGLQVPRPEVVPGAETGYSFPSGHTLKAVVLYGFLSVVISWSIAERWRWLPYTCAGLIVLAVALSRIYLGVHWLSDVLGSLSLGLAWVASLGMAYRRHSVPEAHWRGPTFALLLLLGLSLSVESVLNHNQRVANYTPVPQVTSIPLAEWWQGTDRSLPESRMDIRNSHTRPLNIQYAGSLQTLTERLAGEGWHEAEMLGWRNSLKLLAGGLPLQQIPILPQVHDGAHEALVLVNDRPDDRRLVLRLWPSHRALVPDDGPLWIGNVTDQSREELLGILVYAKTAGGFITSLQSLSEDLTHSGRFELRRQDGVLLVRHSPAQRSAGPDNEESPGDH